MFCYRLLPKMSKFKGRLVHVTNEQPGRTQTTLNGSLYRPGNFATLVISKEVIDREEGIFYLKIF